MNGGSIPASANPGSRPFHDPASDPPALVPEVTGADASGQVLIVTKPGVPGFPVSGPEMPILNARFGDYHDYDYVLFYESIRQNAIDRVKAFVEKSRTSSSRRRDFLKQQPAESMCGEIPAPLSRGPVAEATNREERSAAIADLLVHYGE